NVEGLVTVYATANAGYVLQGYDGPWSYDLGDFEECVVPPTEVVAEEPTYVEATCIDQTPQVVLPVSEVVTYTVEGNQIPGGSVLTTALLQVGVENSVLVSDTSWLHQFAALPNCEVPLIEVEPEEPVVDVIEACGQFGSIELAETVGITYTMVPTEA